MFISYMKDKINHIESFIFVNKKTKQKKILTLFENKNLIIKYLYI